METKECRHCKQPIHKDARRCQHCQGMQGWISDQKDPRMLAVVFIPLLIILAGTIWLSKTVVKPLDRRDIDRSSLTITNVTYRFGSASNRDSIYVYGDLTNSSSLDAGRTCLRVNLRNRQNTIIDTFVQDTEGGIVPANSTRRFRVVAYTPARPDEVKKAEVAVERSRTRGQWD